MGNVFKQQPIKKTQKKNSPEARGREEVRGFRRRLFLGSISEREILLQAVGGFV